MANWDKRYLDLATHVSTWSRDPSTKCGAVLTLNNRVRGIGFNGIPSGLDDDSYLSSRETKIACVIHAESNAIDAANLRLSEFADATLYITNAPCSICAARIVQLGIKRVVIPTIKDKEFAKRWNYHLSEQMFKEVGVEVVEIPED